jgi:hypothetical protein
VRAHDIAVEPLDEQPAALELVRDGAADRRLARAREAGQPDDESRSGAGKAGASALC